MLSKLLKYEFRDTSRTIPLFYLITLIFAGIVLSAKKVGIEWFTITSSLLLLLLGIAVAIITLAVVVMRFYKNFYSNEGYLMFTLPVKPHVLLASKFLVSFTWLILSYGACIGAFFISMYGFGVSGELKDIVEELERFGLQNIFYAIIPLVILSTLYLLAQIYFAITIANRPAFHGIGVASAFLVFLATNVILQLVEAIFTIFVPFSVNINLMEEVSVSLSSKNMFGFLINSMDGSNPQNIVIGLGGYIFELFMVFILFYVTSQNMKNKVSIK
ncbi:MAG: putative transporter, peremase protein [Eubacterium sp.]|jgi:hypothetical protein|nr:putative transporter, peremase protein [Eubacterium sp.]